MTKHQTFENLTGAQFHWPKRGTDPFDRSDDYTNPAITAPGDFSRFSRMLEGYRRSADGLVEMALADWRENDILIYPILFLYRHAIELNLKYIINIHGRHVGVCPVLNSRDFAVLWPRFLAVLDGFGMDHPDTAYNSVHRAVAQFGDVDPNSCSHRYLCDARGNPIPLARERIDLEKLKTAMDGVFAYFEATGSHLNGCVDPA